MIVNSRSESRLQNLSTDLSNHPRLITVHGSLLPGKANETVNKVRIGRGGQFVCRRMTSMPELQARAHSEYILRVTLQQIESFSGFASLIADPILL